MTHVSLDAQHEAVKQFVLGLTKDPNGSVLELNGEPIACVVPPPQGMNGTVSTAEWTDAKNARRCDLIDREYDGLPLTLAEKVELAALQDQMLRYRRRVAPLPIEDARKLHQELLAKAAAQQTPP